MWPGLQVLIEYFSDPASINLSSYFIFLAILHVACPFSPFPYKPLSEIFFEK